MRYAIGLEYDGSAFLGWQIQRQEPTVQACLEKALARVADHDTRVTCCGRTDTGVHALCQVVHFDSEAQRSERNWVLGLNSHLPATVSALWIREVDDEFHARFSAFARSYRYLILNRWVRPAIDSTKLSWCRSPLDADEMHVGAQHLLGQHDFTSFRASACQAQHAVREIHEISVRREGDIIQLDVTANGFLYHMVRNIAGSLLEVGRGDAQPAHVGEVLKQRDRAKAAATAAPEGLYFRAARYPDQYALPTRASAFPRAWNQS